MKDLITAVASILILMIFILQFAGNQVTHARIFQSEMAVETFLDVMKAEGGITNSNERCVKERLAEICGCNEEEILIRGQRAGMSPGKKGTLLEYSVSFPLKNLIVLGSALGISGSENMVQMEEKGWVVSQYEEPDNNHGADSADDHGDDS